MQQSKGYTPGNIHSKPMTNAHASASSYSLKSTTHMSDNDYNPLAPDPSSSAEYNLLQAADQRLKRRIRVLRLISRVVALILSMVTLVPLTMTLAKFLSTKDEYFDVKGQERTAWANDSITWYTYMYFGVALVSCILNLGIVLAYWRGIKRANNVASVASWWSNTVLVAHVLVWVVSAALYRYGKEPVGGKFRDLWGWTCSPAAKAIQKEIPNVDYDKYCTVQTASFYSGLVNVATGILSAFILLLAGLRSKSKKRVAKMSSKHQSDLEPLRS